MSVTKLKPGRFDAYAFSQSPECRLGIKATLETISARFPDSASKGAMVLAAALGNCIRGWDAPDMAAMLHYAFTTATISDDAPGVKQFPFDPNGSDA
jgi:hypothetical protein